MNEQQLRALASVLQYMDRAVDAGLTFSGLVTVHSDGACVKPEFSVAFHDDAGVEAHLIGVDE